VWAARAQLGALLRREPADVGMVHSLWTLAVFGPALRRAGARLAVWVHGVAASPWWLERWAARARPDLVLANSRFTLARVPAWLRGVPAAVVHPPHAAAPPGATRADTRRTLGASGSDVVVLHVGRMEPGKGHRLLLDAFARVAPAGRLWIAGGAQRGAEAAYLAELRARARRHAMESRVTFLGERGDVAALLAAADVFVQPNTTPEGFGLALVEALAAGVPIVATRLGATPELVADQHALLVPPEPEALAGALTALVTDPARRRALAAAGPARAAVLSDPAVVVPQLHDLLRTHPALHHPADGAA
jgi:glycosyltransferase involved in cell wall biosynthesis